MAAEMGRSRAELQKSRAAKKADRGGFLGEKKRESSYCESGER
jgi:hypothetical protein